MRILRGLGRGWIGQGGWSGNRRSRGGTPHAGEDRKQEKVQLGVGCTVACEMMMSMVVQIEAGEGELGQELLEEVSPGCVPLIHVEVTSEINGAAEILENIKHDTLQGSESR